MEELYNIGISDITIKSMLELNPNIKYMTKEEIKIKEEILTKYGCNNKQIINIISSNALYLDESNDNIINKLNYIHNLGFNQINILLDSNPYILSLETNEIKEYIKKELAQNKELVSIIDNLESNPYIFNEM